MDPLKITYRVCLLAVAMSLASCGGGNSSGKPTFGQVGTTTVGAITGFGSVHVNGIQFRTGNDTQILIDDTPSQERALQVGQIVKVLGSIDQDRLHGDAQLIEMDEAVRGQITAIDSMQSAITVLGQTVLVTADTFFDQRIMPADISTLQVGDFIAVSGVRDAEGAIIASFIGPARSGSFEVVGSVSNLDTSLSTFMIGGLVVDYSAAQLAGFATGMLANDDVVEVKGSTLSDAQALVATKIESEAFEDAEKGFHDHNHGMSLEGMVTRFVSVTDFDVADQPVTTTDTTRFENGTADSLALDARVEIRGTLDDAGVLVASEVEFSGPPKVKLAGTVDSVGTDTLTILGVPVQIDASTMLRDDSSADLPTFSLGDVQVGDFVELVGVVSDATTHTVFASRLQRENPSDSVEVRGPVDAVDTQSVSVLGITIGTDATTLFEGRDGQPTDAAGFFSQVVVGDIVRARGIATGPASVVAAKLAIGTNDEEWHHYWR